MIEQACQVFADDLKVKLDLPGDVAVLEATPSAPTDYPACALQIEDTDLRVANDEEIYVDASNKPILGGDLSFSAIDGAASVAMLDSKTQLVNIGTYSMTGKIWVATRYPSERAEFTEKLVNMFSQDDGASLRMLYQLDKPKLLGRTLPWQWPFAVLIDKVKWTREFVFGERVWSWTTVTVDVDILATRSAAPIVKQFILQSQMAATPVDAGTGAVVDDGTFVEEFTVDANGDLKIYP